MSLLAPLQQRQQQKLLLQQPKGSPKCRCAFAHVGAMLGGISTSLLLLLRESVKVEQRPLKQIPHWKLSPQVQS